MLNSREIAILMWSLLIFLWCLSKSKIRQAILGVVKSFFGLFKHAILNLVLLYIICVTCIIYYYEAELIKDYLIWVVFAMFPLMGKITRGYLSINIRILFFETFKFSIIPLFIVNEYTFSIWLELLLVPVTILFALLIAVSGLDKKTEKVGQYFNFILSIIGILVFIFALEGFMSNITDIRQEQFWTKMFMDIIGIILNLPILYFFKISILYEQIIGKVRKSNDFSKKDIFFVVFKRCLFKTDMLISIIKNNRIPRMNSLEKLKDYLR